MLLLALFFPTILMVLSLPLWLIKKLSDDTIKYIVLILYFGYILLLAIGSDAQIIETVFLCIIVAIANLKQLQIYIDKLYLNRGGKNRKLDPEDYNDISCSYEPSDEERLIGVVRKCLGDDTGSYSGNIFLSDDIREIGLFRRYDEFHDAVYKEFHVYIGWDAFSDFTTLQNVVDYIKDHRYDY